HPRGSVLQAVLDRGTSKYRLTYDDRGLQFLRTFVEAREKENYFEVLPADYWDFVPDENGSPAPAAGVTFRPVVDPLGREVTALEAIPDDAPEGLSGDAMYVHNLAAVTGALHRAGRSCPDDMMLYLSILPGTLVSVPDAVGRIVRAIDSAELVPQQIILGVSETEVISQLEAFSAAVRQLKQAGISLS
ncbi:diguanylate phosphodiesterase, partial [Erwiniaceae bacterium L1_55_4]|nr:diguanylate phosphodiesterase [Erwiniaceae bacterium L1_55_4]